MAVPMAPPVCAESESDNRVKGAGQRTCRNARRDDDQADKPAVLDQDPDAPSVEELDHHRNDALGYAQYAFGMRVAGKGGSLRMRALGAGSMSKKIRGLVGETWTEELTRRLHCSREYVP